MGSGDARPQVMKLTDAAAARIRDLMAKGEGVGLRVGVKNGGCAGMEYTMEWAKEQSPLMKWSKTRARKVLIDAKALMFLLGTEMDYQTTVLKSGFVFNNPNQTSACGCGESVELQAGNSCTVGLKLSS